MAVFFGDETKMKIIAASDIHCNAKILRELGDTAARSQVDLILLAGDICGTRRSSDFCRNLYDLAKRAGCPVVLTPGNHDFWDPAQEFPAKQIAAKTDVVCLVDESVEFENIKIFGTPWTETFFDWNWMKDADELHFDIPPDADILICHSPPLGYGDDVGLKRIGSESLTEAIRNHSSLKYVFFGHNHGDRGKRYVINETVLYNVACVDDDYRWPEDGFVMVEI